MLDSILSLSQSSPSPQRRVATHVLFTRNEIDCPSESPCPSFTSLLSQHNHQPPFFQTTAERNERTKAHLFLAPSFPFDLLVISLFLSRFSF